MKKTKILITHQEDKTFHKFKVLDESKLTTKEVKRICVKMNVKAIFIKGKYYENKN
jgi:hypothetical protein